MKDSSAREQIIGILKQQESGIAGELCRQHGASSSATFYKWKSRVCGMNASAEATPT